MDFITQLLAKLFETFKTKNPKAAAAILILVGTILYFASQGTLLGLFVLPTWAAQVITWISGFILAVTGSSTYNYLPPADKKAAADKRNG